MTSQTLATDWVKAPDPVRSTPRRDKKHRSKLRKKVGYTKTLPECCANCQHFEGALSIKACGEYYPPRCLKHLFQVEKTAICDHWELRKNNNEKSAARRVG